MMSQFRVGAQPAAIARASAKRRAAGGNPVHAAQAKIAAIAGGRGVAARAPGEDSWIEF